MATRPQPPASSPSIRKNKAQKAAKKTVELKTKFRAAHAKGMAALERRDYEAVGKAINEESKLIAAQREIIDESQQSVAASSRAMNAGSLQVRANKARQAKKAKKR